VSDATSGRLRRRHFFTGLKYFKSGGGWSLRIGMMVPSPLRK
jgi:hypothetical protein